jgi:mRNA-degrading endonuclease toxin of MazEF toxin-antitoxin module
VLVKTGNGGLTSDSVALCNQIRVLDKRRLDLTPEGTLPSSILTLIEKTVAEVLFIKK